MKRESLVFLVYSPNTAYTQLLEGETPVGCQVDLEKGTWTYRGKVFQIGTEMRHCEWGCRGGVIGVYDRSDFKHLKNLLCHAREAVSSPLTARPEDD